MKKGDKAGCRPWTTRVLAVFLGMVVPLACLEVVMRTLPVYNPPRLLPVDEASPVIRLAPNRAFRWSRNWNFELLNEGRTNNFGFVSDFDYDPDAAGPLLAIVGDSYVQAAMVPFEQTCAGSLAQELPGRARVYAFGVSASPLSQYLVFAEWVQATFSPDALAVVIIHNDYDESLLKYNQRPGFHYFVEGVDGRLQLERIDFRRTFFQRLIRASALARYFAGNADVREGGKRVRRRLALWGERLSSAEPERERSRAAQRAAHEESRVADSKRAIDAFLDRLPAAAGLDPQRIVFAVDGLRPELYREDRLAREAGSYRDVMRRYFITEAAQRGYEVADLQPAMVVHYGAHRNPFEWRQADTDAIIDSHWNALGHELCSDAVARSAVVSEGFPELEELARGAQSEAK